MVCVLSVTVAMHVSVVRSAIRVCVATQRVGPSEALAAAPSGGTAVVMVVVLAVAVVCLAAAAAAAVAVAAAAAAAAAVASAAAAAAAAVAAPAPTTPAAAVSCSGRRSSRAIAIYLTSMRTGIAATTTCNRGPARVHLLVDRARVFSSLQDHPGLQLGNVRHSAGGRPGARGRASLLACSAT